MTLLSSIGLLTKSSLLLNQQNEYVVSLKGLNKQTKLTPINNVKNKFRCVQAGLIHPDTHNPLYRTNQYMYIHTYTTPRGELLTARESSSNFLVKGRK